MFLLLLLMLLLHFPWLYSESFTLSIPIILQWNLLFHNLISFHYTTILIEFIILLYNCLIMESPLNLLVLTLPIICCPLTIYLIIIELSLIYELIGVVVSIKWCDIHSTNPHHLLIDYLTTIHQVLLHYQPTINIPLLNPNHLECLSALQLLLFLLVVEYNTHPVWLFNYLLLLMLWFLPP